jgi:ATP-dependent Lon protease
MSRILPMVALRDVIVFPYMALHFEVGREKSIAALEKAMENDQAIFLAAQKDKETLDPSPTIYSNGNGFAHQTDTEASGRCDPRTGKRREPRTHHLLYQNRAIP